MKTLFTILLATSLLSCSKDEARGDGKTCYECDLQNGNGYQDVGCHTPAEWADIEFSGPNAEQLDKNQVCRRR